MFTALFQYEPTVKRNLGIVKCCGVLLEHKLKKGAEKTALRARFDAIKARVAGEGDAPDAAIEAILNQIGTGLRR